MTIPYPITLPTSPAPRLFTGRARSVVGYSESPNNFVGQAYVHAGQRWHFTVTYPPMPRDRAEALVSNLISLNGMEGRFMLGDYDGRNPRGAATGTPVVDGAGQASQSRVLNTRGWTPSTTNILRIGDYIQLNSGAASRLHKVMKDVNSDAGGLAVLDIWPGLRNSPADGELINTLNTMGVFRLTTNQTEWDTDEASVYGVSFEAMEVV